jgi:hypothetical protein
MDHFSFQYGTDSTGGSISLDTTYYHTGFRSLKVTNNNRFTARKVNSRVSSISSSTTAFKAASPYDFVVPFDPIGGKKFLISGWVRNTALDSTGYIQISFNELDYPINFYPHGTPIEGWQRVEGIFYVGTGWQAINVKLCNRSSNAVYFDDVRIQPVDALVKSFVYHPRWLKPMAILDENNYATFYEYDESGSLIRVKKETEKGILTIKEARKSNVKTPLN